MDIEFYFQFFLFAMIAIVILDVIAKKVSLPPAAAQIVGGVLIAMIPGLPILEINPEFLLVVILPPLLMEGAFVTVISDFKQHLSGILLLAIGAVVFTTLTVGLMVNWLLPSLPLAACFALGAIVSPPDAVAAKAVLKRIPLPRKIMIVLEGESLLNDASGLVLYKFAVAAALTGAFSMQAALTEFTILITGGIALGVVIGTVVVKLLKLVTETYIAIIITTIPAWLSYILGEMLGVSGVFSTVIYGMILGWHQHEVFSATVRRRGQAFWEVLSFTLESLAFILIGIALRETFVRLQAADQSWLGLAIIVSVVIFTVIFSRFIWIFVTDLICAVFTSRSRQSFVFNWRESTIKSWSGMRGVVTLTAAMALPDDFPGRDIILVSAFMVIVMTIGIQGISLSTLIRFLRVENRPHHHPNHLTHSQAWASVHAAQFQRVKELAYDPQGHIIHPRLLEHYAYKADLSEKQRDNTTIDNSLISPHFDVIVSAIEAGRKTLLKLHREGKLHDELLNDIERHLDYAEIAAKAKRD
jgi:Na+/H+ antiporter